MAGEGLVATGLAREPYGAQALPRGLSQVCSRTPTSAIPAGALPNGLAHLDCLARL